MTSSLAAIEITTAAEGLCHFHVKGSLEALAEKNDTVGFPLEGSMQIRHSVKTTHKDHLINALFFLQTLVALSCSAHLNTTP